MNVQSPKYYSGEFNVMLNFICNTLQQSEWNILPHTIQTIRKKYTSESTETINHLIDLALGMHKADLSGEYEELQPWLFTKQTFEQCSAPDICNHHMQRLQIQGQTILEICTGSGMDAYAAMKLGASSVKTIEKEESIAQMAIANFEAHSLPVNVLRGDAEHMQLPTADILWADPSRREFKSERTSLFKHYAPDLEWLVSQAREYKRAGIKIAPGEDIEGDFSREFIGYGRECREQILWFSCDIPDGTVTLVDKEISFYPTNKELPKLIDIDKVSTSMTLVEPHPALIRGELSSFYAEHNITVFDRSIAYGIAENIIEQSAFFSRFDILHSAPFNKNELQELIYAYEWNAETEIKKRGFPVLPDEMRRKLNFVKGSKKKGVIILTRSEDKHYMFLCNRL